MIVSNIISYESISSIGINRNGGYLAQIIDTSNVDKLWLPHVHIHWDTGEPNLENINKSRSTHCSAFVAAFAKSLNIYILHPPEHGQKLLANAQIDWLNSLGTKYGWNALSNMKEAQVKANEGNLVLATWRNPNSNRPGHIAIVRPSKKNEFELQTDGPEIAQAGISNSINTSAKIGFKHHIGNWVIRSKEVKYFTHTIDINDLIKHLKK